MRAAVTVSAYTRQVTPNPSRICFPRPEQESFVDLADLFRCRDLPSKERMSITPLSRPFVGSPAIL